MPSPIILIPARLGSTRLPGKPLADIAGLPMIVHVLRRAQAAAVGPVVIACAEPAIAAAVRKAAGIAIMTDPDLPSGSDRIAAALAEFDPARTHDIVINLQGDLPGFDPATLHDLLAVLDNPGFDIATLVAPITSPDEAAADQVVKAACGFEAGDIAPALYFSRHIIPSGAGPLWHHVGVYAYRRAALERFVAAPPSPLERREKLEQLRALELGLRIGAARIAHAPFGVDTPDDLARARRALAAKDITDP
ncbi:3-deoxy-manno-octulosonate cytidylyltransferase [Acidiphilium sp. PA]|uniref:3-deoxy-manno-octulosonate cytidylyltransferase n=1 Tax=Acidiphilium sp. PA TaxID=2871705 RepID=UPI0022433B25|nr:3-deoxy-manno-octulosonate cytidylyltransferase [Acidiphilium sp. PA]MCW8305644.1 3-deoxy-manno-octulosonate cytidylyltransferase [Acidiphilium sp. PA]